MIKTGKRWVQVAKRYKYLKYDKKALACFFRTMDALEWCSIPNGELSIVFIDDEAIGELHGKFLKDPEPTDVITFPGDEMMDFAGEICVSVERAIAVSEEQGESFSKELALYIVHGWLHLSGFDDQTGHDRIAMREAERKCFQSLEKAGTAPVFSLA